jgi:hypothetical protein
MEKATTVFRRKATPRSLRRFLGLQLTALGLLCLALPVSQATGAEIVLSTAAELLANDPRRFAELLRAVRPAPVPEELRARVLDGLPRDGEVTVLGRAARERLATLGPLLREMHRDGVYAVKVIDVPQATLAMHARVVLLISQPALDMLGAEELQALAAHEFGHEYVWAQYERASAARDHARLRELEMLCDAIAVVTIQGLGIDPERLVGALEKVGRYNDRRFGTAITNVADYPTGKQRQAFVRAVAAWVARGESDMQASRALAREPPLP